MKKILWNYNISQQVERRMHEQEAMATRVERDPPMTIMTVASMKRQAMRGICTRAVGPRVVVKESVKERSAVRDRESNG